MKKCYEKIMIIVLSMAMVCTGGTFAFATDVSDADAQSENTQVAENVQDIQQDTSIDMSGQSEEDEDNTNILAEEEALLAEIDAKEEAVLETAGERVEGNITVHYPPSLSTELDTTVTAYYTDDFFSSDNSVYNKKLAKFTLATAMAGFAYASEDLTDSDGNTIRDKNIRKLLTEDLKFTDYKSFKYDVRLDNSDDTAGYAFAYKELENGERVMAVVIRSSGYGSEWASNLRVTGGNDEHKGFAATADAVYKDAAAYAKANGITKIWITGYSRGAAVANVLGKRVADNKLVDAENMYCYTYETPTTTKKSVAVQGLYNVVNSADVVAQIPFYFWGYRRYGQDEFYVVNKISIKNYKKGMAPTSKTTKSRLTALKKKLGGYTVPTQWSNDITLKSISSIFGGNEAAFKNNYESLLQAVGGMYLGGEKNLYPRKAKQGQSVVDIMETIGLHSYLKSNGVNADSVFAQHTPEALLFWMDTISPCETLNYKYITFSSGYKKCNIVIKDSKGKKVAEINSGNYSKFIKKNSKYSLEVNKDENGNLQILLPTDDKYTIKLTAKSAVTLDYKISDYSCGNVIERADYKNIKLKKKGTITAKATNNYAPKTTKGTVGSQNIYDSASVDVAGVYATVQNGSNFASLIQTSFVTGVGRYPDNYEVTLTVHNAEPKTYVIDGWYLDGEKISDTTKCTVTTDAAKTKNLVVKFKEKS